MISRGEGPRALGRAHGLWAAAFLVLAAAGGLAFAALASGPAAPRAWQAYLVNFVFWTGLASGAVLLSPVLTLTGGRWAGPVQRHAEAFAAFLPVCCLLFGVLWFGRDSLFPALAEAPAQRRLWLSPVFLFARDGVALAALAASGLALRAGGRRGGSEGGPQGPAVVYALLYAVVLSLLGFDWVMSLDAHWVSTLFGAYYVVGSFYTGLAALAVLSGLFAARGESGAGRLQDLGTLLLAFAFTTGYLFYVQFLVIWFDNVPAETRFVLLRLRASPWAPLTWLTLAAGFGLPVSVLLFRRAKARGGILAGVGVAALAGMWLERFLLVAPSLSRNAGPLPLGLPEALVTGGFLGAAGLGVMAGLGRGRPAPGAPDRGERTT